MKSLIYSKLKKRRPPLAEPCFAESGDTLVEILVAIVIIGLTIVSLMGVLTTSITSSAEYRTLATVDTVLKDVGDAIKSDIQPQSPTSSIYQNCAMSYRVVSEYPTSTVPGGYITVFGTGFISGNSVSVSLTNAGGTTPIPPGNFVSGQLVAAATAVPSFTDGVATNGSQGFTSATANFSPADNGEPIDGADIPSGTTISNVSSSTTVTLSNPATGSGNVAFSLPDRYGTVSATFQVPTSVSPAGSPYSVVLSDGTYSATSTTLLTVASSPPPATASAVAGFTVGISSIGWWNSAIGNLSFDSPFASPPIPCTTNDDSGIQMITLVATAPNHVTGTLQIVVTNPALDPPPAPPMTVSAPITSVGQSGTFNATVTGTNGITPTGEVGWSFSSTSPGSPTCNTSNLNPTMSPPGNSATATCVIAAAQAGMYQVTANYSGDGNYGFASGFATLTVGQAIPTVTISAPPTTTGQTLNFTASVTGSGGITPTGQIVWTVSPSSPGSPTPTCGPSPGNLTPGSAGTASVACSISSAQLSPPPYSITAAYSGDDNYTPASASGTATIHQPFTIKNIQFVNGSGTAGKISGGDSIVITFSAQANEGSICTSWAGNTGNSTDTATVNVSGGTLAADNDLTLVASDCAIGSIALGSGNDPSYVTSGSAIFASSTIRWNSSTFTLTIMLNNHTGTGTRHVVNSSTPEYTVSPITDSFGDAVSTPYADTTPQQI
jgi:type II secretory pathway pseudopilin PulG